MYFIDTYPPPMSQISFTEIMDLCFQKSDYFSLTYQSYPGKTNELITELYPYRQRRIKTNKWFCYISLRDDPFEVFLYPSNHNTELIIKKYYTGFFLHNAFDNTLEYNQSLEDLCFFSNGKLIWGTVSHESICAAYPPDEEFKTRLMGSYSHWESRDDDTGQINLSDYISL